MASSVPTAEQIQQQMQQVRTDLREDVRELVESARDMTVWQRYVQAYPWLCVGVAAFAGYMIVPARARIAPPDARLVADLVNSQVARQLAEKSQPGGGLASNLISGVVGLAAKGLLNQGVSILGQQLKEFLARSLASHAAEPHTNGKEH